MVGLVVEGSFPATDANNAFGAAICAAAGQARALACLTERTARLHTAMERFRLQRAEAYAHLRCTVREAFRSTAQSLNCLSISRPF